MIITTSLLHSIHITFLCGGGTGRKFPITDINLLCLVVIWESVQML